MLHDMYKETSVLRPIEVVTSVERRRRWSREEKARIVAASFAPGVTVVEVARRHEISPQHLHQWRRAARGGKLIVPLDDEMAFATVMIDGAQNDRQRASGGVEVEIQGAVVRVNAGTDLGLMTAVVRALKAAG
jgi:transposase